MMELNGRRIPLSPKRPIPGQKIGDSKAAQRIVNTMKSVHGCTRQQAARPGVKFRDGTERKANPLISKKDWGFTVGNDLKTQKRSNQNDVVTSNDI